MKKITIIIFLLTGILGYGQSAKKRISRGDRFLKEVRVREVLDTILWDKESQIFNQTQKLFEQRNLDPNNPTDYEFYQSSLMQQFLFSKMHILNQIKFRFRHYPYEDLGRYILEIQQGKRHQVVYSSGLYAMINELIKVEMNQIKHFTIPRFLDIIERKHKPVNLHLQYNNKPVTADQLDLDVVVETNNADYKSVSILDKKNNQLLKPEGYTYDQIQQIKVIYKGQEFVFKPDDKLLKLPKSIREVNNFVSKYSFEAIPVWRIDIKEAGNTVGVRLSNVVSTQAVKTKKVKRRKKIHKNRKL